MEHDDPRHGEERGYYTHRRDREPVCDACQTAHRAASKRRTLNSLQGVPNRDVVPACGSIRRIRALARLGWTSRIIADVAGLDRHTVQDIRRSRCDTVSRRVADKITTAYNRLSMRIPVGATLTERGHITKTRRRAEAEGWAPPLAWDDDQLDNPTGHPARSARRRADTLGEFEHLVTLGVSQHDAARRLGVTLDAIEKARERARLTVLVAEACGKTG